MNQYQRLAFVLACGLLVTALAASARGEWWGNVVVISDEPVAQDAKSPAQAPEGYIVGGCGDAVTKACGGWWAGYCRTKHFSCIKRLSGWDNCGCGHDKAVHAEPACGCGHKHLGCGHKPHTCGHKHHLGCGHKPHACGHDLGCGCHGHKAGCGFHARKHVRSWRGCGCDVMHHGCGCGSKADWAPTEAAGEAAEPMPMPPTPVPDNDNNAA